MPLAHDVYVLGFAAGGLSTLSPCVLPLLPIRVGSALNAHRFGMLALAAGLALSFAAIGIFIATAGFALGVDDGVFRVVAGVLIGAFGILLLSAHLQTRFAQALSGVEARFGGVLARIGGQGINGQFLIGLMLVVSVLVLSGWDKSLETAFVVHAPNWLTNISGLI